MNIVVTTHIPDLDQKVYINICFTIHRLLLSMTSRGILETVARIYKESGARLLLFCGPRFYNSDLRYRITENTKVVDIFFAKYDSLFQFVLDTYI